MRWRTANKRARRTAWAPRSDIQWFWDEGRALGRAMRAYVTSNPASGLPDWSRHWVLDPGREEVRAWKAARWEGFKALALKRLSDPVDFDAEFLASFSWRDK